MNEIRGYDDIERAIAGRNRVRVSPCRENMRTVHFLYGSQDEHFPNGHKELVPCRDKYNPAGRSRLTKLFAAFGLLVLVLVLVLTL